MSRPFALEHAADEREFEAQLSFAFPGVSQQIPRPYETWVGVVPETKGTTLIVIDVHDDGPVPYVEVGSRQLGPGMVRLVVFGRYFELAEEMP
jgi:hypothetical protein